MYIYIYGYICIFRHILYVLREYFLQWNALQWNIQKPDSPAFTSYLQALHMCPTHPAISIPSGAESSASASIDSHHPPHHRFRRWRPRCGRERSFDTLGPSLLRLPWRQRTFQEVIPKSSLQCFPLVNASEAKHGPYIPKKASATPAQDVQPRKVLLRKLDHARPHGNAALNQNDPKAVSCKTNMNARFTK